jgi:UDP:flavonoid glycosyltransferase YjiC (YdhE family)
MPDDPPFASLDFVYHPSHDVKRDLAYFTDVLGGRLRFAVEGICARVAAIELAPPPPLLLLADHVEGETPILVYRVGTLRAAMTRLERQGWQREQTFEIPHGPICSFRTPGGLRIAVYELTRPGAADHFEGRRDF